MHHSQPNPNFPLHTAAENGSLSKILELISLGNDVNQKNAEGRSPLWLAARNGHLDCIQELIRSGGLVNTDHNLSTLGVALLWGHIDCCQMLVAAGASLNVFDVRFIGEQMQAKRYTTELHMAAEYGHIEKLRAFLPSPLLNEINSSGETPLMVAAKRGHTDCVRLLIAAGAQLDFCHPETGSALHRAATFDRVECVRELIKAGADLRCGSFYAKTPWMLAHEHENHECARLLREAEEAAGLMCFPLDWKTHGHV